jgi:hypothetical protein
MRILSRPENVRDRRGHRRARSVQSLGWLFGILARRRPPEYRDTEKRSSRRRTISGTRDRSRNAIARVRRAARTPHHHSHDLRHRTITLWHGQRGPALDSGEPASQRRVSATVGIYTQVMPLEEATAAFRRLLDLTIRLRRPRGSCLQRSAILIRTRSLTSDWRLAAKERRGVHVHHRSTRCPRGSRFAWLVVSPSSLTVAGERCGVSSVGNGRASTAWQGWQGLAFAWVRSTVRSPARLAR